MSATPEWVNEKITKNMKESFARFPDANINPNHYKIGGLETWDILKVKLTPEQLKGFALGNCIKYLTRAEHKGGIEDYKKAQWYLNKLTEE